MKCFGCQTAQADVAPIEQRQGRELLRKELAVCWGCQGSVQAILQHQSVTWELYLHGVEWKGWRKV